MLSTPSTVICKIFLLPHHQEHSFLSLATVLFLKRLTVQFVWLADKSTHLATRRRRKRSAVVVSVVLWAVLIPRINKGIKYSDIISLSTVHTVQLLRKGLFQILLCVHPFAPTIKTRHVPYGNGTSTHRTHAKRSLLHTQEW